MNKGELIEAVAGASGLSRADTTKAVDAVLETVTKTLASGADVSLVGFGTFKVRGQKDKVGEPPKRAKIDRCRETPLVPETR